MIIGSNNWNDIAFGNGQYVAVGDSGYVTTSTSGSQWSSPKKVNQDMNWKLNSIIYQNSEFLATGGGGYIFRSKDGNSWTTKMAYSPIDFLDIAYGGSLYVITGAGGYIATVNNNFSISVPKKVGIGDDWVAVTYGKGMFIAIGGAGYITISNDGKIWSEPYRIDNSIAVINDIVYANGQFVVCGQGSLSGDIFVSSDGHKWKPVRSRLSTKLHKIIYAYEQFIVFGDNGIVGVSTTGKNWEKKQAKIENGGDVSITPIGVCPFLQ